MSIISIESIISVSANILPAIINIFRYSRQYDDFLIKTSVIISKSQDFIHALNSQSIGNDDVKDFLIKEWMKIHSSEWLSLPAKSKAKLKQLSYWIASDMCRLRASSSPDDIEELKQHLQEVTRIIEKLIHPKFDYSLKLAINSTRKLLEAPQNQYRKSTFSMNQQYAGLQRDWNRCRRLSKYTNPVISKKCKDIQSLVHELVSKTTEIEDLSNEQIIKKTTDFNKQDIRSQIKDRGTKKGPVEIKNRTPDFIKSDIRLALDLISPDSPPPSRYCLSCRTELSFHNSSTRF